MRYRVYNGAVRYYTTKSLNGGITFTCIFCPHSVTTLDFDHTRGNCRTQAASAMNEHAQAMHASNMRDLAPEKSGGF